jgi:hypothetical protein
LYALNTDQKKTTTTLSYFSSIYLYDRNWSNHMERKKTWLFALMLAYLTSLLLFKYASCGLVSFMHMKNFFLNSKEWFQPKLEITLLGNDEQSTEKKINQFFQEKNLLNNIFFILF